MVQFTFNIDNLSTKTHLKHQKVHFPSLAVTQRHLFSSFSQTINTNKPNAKKQLSFYFYPTLPTLKLIIFILWKTLIIQLLHIMKITRAVELSTALYLSIIILMIQVRAKRLMCAPAPPLPLAVSRSGEGCASGMCAPAPPLCLAPVATALRRLVPCTCRALRPEEEY